MIRISIPALTEERRKDLSEIVKKYAEEAKVAIRNIRRDANDELKKLEKNGEITEDELSGYQEDIQKLTDKYIEKLMKLQKIKKKKSMEVLIENFIVIVNPLRLRGEFFYALRHTV